MIPTSSPWVPATGCVVTAAKPVIEIGTTVKVVNVVRAKTLNWRLKLGDNVVYQETVSTGKASAVDILLIDESTLIMGETSELILDNLHHHRLVQRAPGRITDSQNQHDGRRRIIKREQHEQQERYARRETAEDQQHSSLPVPQRRDDQ